MTRKCFHCGVELTPENDSGWEVFTGAKAGPPPAGQDYLGATAPICKSCFGGDEEQEEKNERD